MIAIDVDMATSGYLRFIVGLDRPAQGFRHRNVRIRWLPLPGGSPAVVDRRARTIYLSWWAFWAWPWYARRVLTHELGHILAGWLDEYVQPWRRRRYGELVAPVWTA